jgi:hypothetical protein
MLSKILAYLKANPALAGGVVSVALTLAAGFGLHFTTDQLALFAALVSAVSHGLVHVTTAPAGAHEAAAREEHQ